ncbi:hypothetical protein chiPu_0031839 [Chiloscyllium punctatum]|uniref:Uncharacterized protein n=1 Tax=Chiloscyllium punctatum TaxID=137246 RepID=A0A401TYU8_CHIPU|nr:hypothetical protein [Chiloscyllium punctatum]
MSRPTHRFPSDGHGTAAGRSRAKSTRTPTARSADVRSTSATVRAFDDLIWPWPKHPSTHSAPMARSFRYLARRRLVPPEAPSRTTR